MPPNLVSLVQVNFQQGPREFNSYYLPYTAGVLWAYAQQHEEIRQHYRLDQLIWRRDPVEETAQRLKHNMVIGFSTYVWNKNYNYALAARLKQLNPSAVLIFGGPEVPVTAADIFKRHPFMDYVICGEGEIIFANLLLALTNGRDPESVAGLLINDQGRVIKTEAAERISDLDQIPSPYLLGLFDRIMAENPAVEWNATIETNRGCPYACTFCDWGSLTYSKVKKFNLERVFAEIDWVGRKGCGFVSLTDANFGQFVERDNLIADQLLATQHRYDAPSTFSVTWAKNQRPEVIDIVEKLIKSPKFNQGLTVSVQSMNLDVLENIKRRNLGQHLIEEIFARCDQRNIPVYTEVIMGLPGETLETWRDGFWQLFRAGNHTGIHILQAQMLENAEMNLLQKKLYGIESIEVYDYISGSYQTDEYPESVSVVTATNTIPFEHMLEGHMFNWYINTFHISGLTTWISRYLARRYGVDYEIFYTRFWEFLQQDAWFQQEQHEVRAYFNNWMTQGRINHPKIYGIEMHGWNIIYRTLLNMHAKHEYDHVYGLIEQFVTKNWPCLEMTALIEFQKNYVINYWQKDQYPVTQKFDYDFLDYLRSNAELNRPVTYCFEFVEDPAISFERFLENLYFSRKRNFGKAVITRL
jgi:tRNA A37 methylthiotransferase MiaB